MKVKLSDNSFSLKLLSLIIGFVIWYVINMVANPTIDTYIEIPVEITGSEILENQGLAYEMEGKSTVTVYYSVSSMQQRKINASCFKATADLTEMYDVTGSVRIRVEVISAEAKKLLSKGPDTRDAVIRIRTEEMQEKQFPVNYQLFGQPAEDYVIGEIDLTPEVITVKGPRSLIGRINSVGVEIGIDRTEIDLEGTAEVNLYDSNHNKLTGLGSTGRNVTLSDTEVNYMIPVLKVKRVPLAFEVNGEVADGYRYTGVECAESMISVQGLKSALASLNTITVSGELLNLEEAKNDITLTVDLNQFLADNIVIAPDSPTEVKVTLKVEPLEQRTITIPSGRIILEGQDPDLQYMFGEKEAGISIRGLKEDLDQLDRSNPEGLVDVTGLTQGNYMVDVTTKLDEGFEIMEAGNILLHVYRGEEPLPAEEADENGPGQQQG